MPTTVAPPAVSSAHSGEVFPDPFGAAPIRAEVYGQERLEAQARELATASTSTPWQPTAHAPGGRARPLLPRLRDNGRALREAHRELAAGVQRQETLTPDAEWLLDNFFIIEAALREVRQDLPHGYYHELPRLTSGPLAGMPRIYALALGLVAHTDSSLNDTQILQYVRAFQTVSPLTIGELWAVPTMLRLALLENLRRLADQLTQTRAAHASATTWADAPPGSPPPIADAAPGILVDPFIVGLTQVLRDHGPGPSSAADWLEGWLGRHGLSVADVLRREYQRQAANQVSIGNAVTSLRLLGVLDWYEFFEQASVTEALLRGDPSGIYPRQDFGTRDRCRRAVEKLARGSKRPEEEVARRALELAAVPSDDPHRRHLSYYLIGDGRPEFEVELGYRPALSDALALSLTRHARTFYFGGLAIVWTGVVFSLLTAAGAGWSWMGLLLLAAVLLPASELAVGLLHFAITRLVPPRVLPKLDFKEGIPPDCSTFVVIPSLLIRPDSARQLLERLEMHYLANPDPQLRFALLTDFADAPLENMPEDDALVKAALEGVRALNARHAAGGAPRFFLFHRRRLWNASENHWMGWERKRGKLQEFNRLMRGDRSTSYHVLSSPQELLPHVRYVLTLDADTRLPPETARRLIATLAHPLNQARFDPAQRRVVAGYGVLQPRVSFLYRTGMRSWFARLFAYSAGVDPYSAAVSDVYQDLFGLGTFTGKGLYDLDAFEAATESAFPDNHILSHDLIEGNFARCGLVSDVELFDDFPAKYHAYARREHRWVRGDWQLLPWLGRRVPVRNAEGGGAGERPAVGAGSPRPSRGRGDPAPTAGRSPTAEGLPESDSSFEKNPLPALERWKVLDNLRRSLVPPATVALLALGWTVLPGSPWLWTGVGLAVVALPLLLQILGALLDLLLGTSPRGVWNGMRSGAPTTAGQVMLSATFLVHQARLDLNAIGITLSRLCVSRRHLLEWETAAAAEQRLGGDLHQFISTMWPSSALAVALGALVYFVAPGSLLAALPFLLLWLLAPLIAYWVSQPLRSTETPLSASERRSFRRTARKTWGFFETFVGDEDHWLPPDNYQENPKGQIAHRTSPTNKGLLLLSTLAAHDLGYVSLPVLADRLGKTFDTFAKLERYRGHFLNWYDTHTLQPLRPAYVSTVDSGNLLGCLLALAHGLQEKLADPFPSPAVREGLLDTLDLVALKLGRARSADAEAMGLWRAAADAVDEMERALLEWSSQDLLRYHEGLLRVEREGIALKQRLTELSGRLAHRPNELLRWSEALATAVRDRRQELDSLAPWLPLLEEKPQCLPAEAAAKWTEFSRELAAPLKLREWSKHQAHLTTELAAWDKRWPASADASANLPARLVTAVAGSQAAKLIAGVETLTEQAYAYAVAMDFRFLYNPHRDLFAIGFNLDAGRADNSHYDLLASEACLASFLAVARGEVPKKHWFQLARPATLVAGYQGLLSWGGTMFEYLMPRLLLPANDGTLLDEVRLAAVARQIEYGGENGVPWGISESAFNVLDAAQDYQYQSFGVPGLGLKRGLALDLVVAPYATLLAAGIAPHAAARNLDALRALGAEGPYGFYEAVDFTPSRLAPGERLHVVRSYMAHHQGMGLVALTNRLLGDVMPRRLRAEPRVRASELLLQERVPFDAPVVVTEDATETTPQYSMGAYPVSRRINTPHTPGPRTHVLSNGRYTVLMTNAGGGFSTCNDLAVSRWREDRTTDATGSFCYIRDLKNGITWSAGYQPTGRAADEYEVVYSIDKAEIRRRDGDVETLLEVVVSPEKDVEVRRLTLMNHGRQTQELELTSYLEVVLVPQATDLAHPAFQKLFLETEWQAGLGALLCQRRPRSPEQAPVWALHVVAVDGTVQGSPEFETDRFRFVGRRRTPSHPVALDPGAPPLSGTVGPVLDPVFALRQRLRLEPGESTMVAFSTAVVGSREDALTLADEFRSLSAVTRVFDLAWAHSRVELRHLGMSVEDAHLFQRLAGHVLFAGPHLRGDSGALATNLQGQPGLWRLGISGDLPIVLVRVDSGRQAPLVRQALQAHAYWRAKGLKIDLVLFNEDPSGYLDELQTQLQGLVRAIAPDLTTERPGGVFVRKASHLTEADRLLLLAAARVVLVGEQGPLANQIDVVERRPTLPRRLPAAGRPEGKSRAHDPYAPPPAGLLFDNGLGGFTPDGREYVIYSKGGGKKVPQTVGCEGAPATLQVPELAPPAPWINVVANPSFGFLVSDSGSGYTWAGNSQTNRLTPWSNDPVCDPSGEAVYLRDEVTGEFWTPTPLPACGTSSSKVRHGQGYTVFEQRHSGLELELRLTVASDDPVKLLRLTVRNRGHDRRRLSATFYAEWVLGTVRDQTAMYLVTEADDDTGALFARNAFNADFGSAIAFAAVDQAEHTLTGDRTEFLGRNGSTGCPAALKREALSGRVGAGLDPCAALQTRFQLEGGAEKVIVFLLGQAADRKSARRLVRRYRDRQLAETAANETRNRWDRLLTTVQVKTPNPALDLLVNRWLLTQVLACRYWGRSAFYQSSGAYGFRDQLQDVMALVYAAPDQVRAHLLRAAAHQFEEGDVQHWWHPPSGRGVRTRFSDDFLWLPLVVHHYVSVTGDTAVLDEKVPFLHAPPLSATQEEVYGLPTVSSQIGTLYEHCHRALENGWKLGVHGLPLMGTGDWNDGMNRVGNEGRGESVWDGWFQMVCLTRFADLAQARGESEHAAVFRERAAQLHEAIETHAWDGEWYRRAYFDDGTPLGSASNDECQIDSIAQTWAVMAGADPERARRSMDSLLTRLVKRDERLLLLFDPPFKDGKLQPGYIKGYLPGIRENGGQYTHAAAWVVEAFAQLGRGTLALEMYDLLNPIHQGETPQQVARYRVEPYVLAGDVYSQPPHVGRGGWTWYTGSAAWLYRVALETLLGFQKRGSRLRLAPCIPADWPRFEITFRFGATLYQIVCENPHQVEKGTARVWLDGAEQPGDGFDLVEDGGTHSVRVELTSPER